MIGGETAVELETGTFLFVTSSDRGRAGGGGGKGDYKNLIMRETIKRRGQKKNSIMHFYRRYAFNKQIFREIEKGSLQNAIQEVFRSMIRKWKQQCNKRR